MLQLIEKISRGVADRLRHPALRQYLGNGEILVDTHHFPMIVPGWDMSLSPCILIHRDWEPPLTNYLKARIKPGMIAFDVGANIGWFSCLFATRGALVHAFEPNPRLQTILKKNIFMNAKGFTPKCAVNQCAVGEHRGVFPMRFPHWLVGGAGLHDFDQSPFLDSLIDQEVNTNVITLDEYCREKGITNVDVIKIDIEGYEERALLGATELINNSPNLMLSIEYTRKRYSTAFASWLFERFKVGYLPGLDRFIDVAFLQEYEAGNVLPDQHFIDIVFSKE